LIRQRIPSPISPQSWIETAVSQCHHSHIQSTKNGVIRLAKSPLGMCICSKCEVISTWVKAIFERCRKTKKEHGEAMQRLPAIQRAASRAAAEKGGRQWSADWRKPNPAAAVTLAEQLARLLNFYAYPIEQR
jgi:hypothetical protein